MNGIRSSAKETHLMATTAIVGQKVGMTQVWDDQNRIIPVTVLEVEPLRVVQIRTPERDGYSALQVTFGTKKASKLSKPVAGQHCLAGLSRLGQRVPVGIRQIGDQGTEIVEGRRLGHGAVLRMRLFCSAHRAFLPLRKIPPAAALQKMIGKPIIIP